MGDTTSQWYPLFFLKGRIFLQNTLSLKRPIKHNLIIMNNFNQKRILVLLSALMLMVVFSSCNKEDPLTPSANFTTNIENNTLMAGQGFTVYLDDVQGEWLVYFRGNNLESTYDPDDPTRRGTPFSSEREFLNIPGYNPTVDTDYVFTMVASSSGNWGKDYVQDVKSITIHVKVP